MQPFYSTPIMFESHHTQPQAGKPNQFQFHFLLFFCEILMVHAMFLCYFVWNWSIIFVVGLKCIFYVCTCAPKYLPQASVAVKYNTSYMSNIWNPVRNTIIHNRTKNACKRQNENCYLSPSLIGSTGQKQFKK